MPGLCSAARAWLTSAMIPAHCGEPQLVPPKRPKLPSSATSTPPLIAASYATSGTARVETPVRPAWYDGAGQMRLGAPPVATGTDAMSGSFHVCSPPYEQMSALASAAVALGQRPSGYGSACVPPMLVTSGSEAGYCGLFTAVPLEAPKSPADAMIVSPRDANSW